MICLSRLILNPRSRDVQRDLADCQALHRTIMSAFPPAPDDARPREHFGVLFRLDTSSRAPGSLALLVQSEERPDWSRLGPGYLLDTGGEPPNPAIKRVDERYQSIDEGMVLRFRLRANPTRKIDTRSGPDGARRNGQRVDLRGEAARIEWLRRKGEQSGFRLVTVSGGSDLPSVLAMPNDKITGRHPVQPSTGTASPGRLTFASVLFDGTLVVTNHEWFQEALRRGVGTGKAYGFGLLSVARPTER